MSKTLVAYFSASGVTARLAKNLANAIGADIFEICPEVPYTDADLNWNNPKSRSSVEMKDKAFRPAVASVFQQMEQYDLSGKTIIPFATSGGSGMGNTNRELAPSCKGAKLAEGRRFSANAKEEELKNWAAGF